MKIFLFFITFFLSILTVWAQEVSPSAAADDVVPSASGQALPLCRDVYTLSGPRDVKANTAYEYMLSSGDTTVLPVGTFTLLRDGVVHTQRVDGEKYVHSFSEPGELVMEVELDAQDFHCQGTISETIYVHREHILYVGSEKEWLSDAELLSVFRGKSILFETLFTANNFQLGESSQAWNSLGSADIIIFSPHNILSLFSEMERLQRIKEINFSKKRLYIISDYQRSFLSKVLASSVAKLGMENVTLITEDQFSALLNRWGFSDDRNATAGQALSYEKNHFVLTLNSFLEYLAYSGVSYQFLGFLLSLSVVALVMNIFKQVIGLDVFSVYYPLLLAIIFSQMGLSFSLVFLVIALISLILVSVITQRIQLLVTARKSFLVSTYVLITFLVLGFENFFGFGVLRYAAFDMPAAIISIFAILFVVERLYDHSISFSKSGMIDMLQYAFVVMVVYFLLNFKDLQYFLISYPDVILLIVLANLLVGRYMGLQLTEYLRFAPILRNINEEE